MKWNQDGVLLGLSAVLMLALVAYNALMTPPIVGVQSIRYLETSAESSSSEVISSSALMATEEETPSESSEPSETDEEASAASNAVVFPININTAEAWELDALPRIGPVIAERIIDYRLANGPFEYYEQIMDVSGIGQTTYEAIYDYITIEQ